MITCAVLLPLTDLTWTSVKRRKVYLHRSRTLARPNKDKYETEDVVIRTAAILTQPDMEKYEKGNSLPVTSSYSRSTWYTSESGNCFPISSYYPYPT